jgi:hypothetical protein
MKRRKAPDAYRWETLDRNYASVLLSVCQLTDFSEEPITSSQFNSAFSRIHKVQIGEPNKRVYISSKFAMPHELLFYSNFHLPSP